MTDLLLSHAETSVNLAAIVQETAERIQQDGALDGYSVESQLQLLEELQGFELGRFLLVNKGLNGYWTHYVLTHPWHQNEKQLTELEQFILEKSPLTLAIQERFQIYLDEAQKLVQQGACFASIPSGTMGELLYLDFPHIDQMSLVGIDYDPDTLAQAQVMAEERKLTPWVTLEQANAWDIKYDNAFDLISSNGLSIYESNDDRVVDLYRVFYQALKPEGTLITSFITPPPTLTNQCEWRMNAINSEHLLKQKVLYNIIGGKWQCFRSTETTRSQLEAAGFNDVSFIPDKAGMYPTVVAKKS